MIIKTGIIPEIAFEIFGIPIYWYAILMTMSFVIALIIYKIKDRKKKVMILKAEKCYQVVQKP